MRIITILLAVSVGAPAQIRVTADLLSPQTTAAMFSKLPKPYSAASVAVCNQAASPVTIPLALAAQQVRLSGVVMLPKDAALSVIAAAQGSTAWNKALRGGIAAVQIGAIAAGWSSLSATVKNTLTSAALAGSSAISVLSTTIPTHSFASLLNESLPDPLQLSALGCSTGIVLVEATTTRGIDSTVAIPSGGKQ